jgi:hypothetical protein
MGNVENLGIDNSSFQRLALGLFEKYIETLKQQAAGPTAEERELQIFDQIVMSRCMVGTAEEAVNYAKTIIEARRELVLASWQSQTNS